MLSPYRRAAPRDGLTEGTTMNIPVLVSGAASVLVAAVLALVLWTAVDSAGGQGAGRMPLQGPVSLAGLS